MRGVRVTFVALLVLGAALLGMGGPAPAPAQSPDSNPLAGMRFFVDRDSPSWNQWQAYRRRGETRKADLVWRIAREPKALWLGRWTRPNFHVKVRRLIDAAAAEGAVPIFTVHARPVHGLRPALHGRRARRRTARTRAWYADLARAIGGSRVVIAFEPDSLGTIDCHARSRRDDRIKLLRYGIDQLAELPERHDLHRGRRLRLGARPPHRERSFAPSASGRCAGSC